MIDICFGDCLFGVLKVVQKKLRSKDVLTLLMNLPYGKVDRDVIEAQARREADTLWYCYKDITELEVQENYEEFLEGIQTAHQKLKKHFENGESFRLWLNNNARDRCALYWFCSIAQGYENYIEIVYQPRYEYNDITKKVKTCTCWELIDDFDLLATYIEKAVKLEDAEKQAYVAEWNRIVADNAPLRILIDNTIVGVKEDFFDDTILNFVSNEPRTQSYVMGTMLGKWQSGCDVAFISQRIEHLIESGKIKVCEEKVDEEGCYWARTLILA